MSDRNPLIQDAFSGEVDVLPPDNRDRIWANLHHRQARQERRRFLRRAGLLLLSAAVVGGVLALWLFIRSSASAPGELAAAADSLTMFSRTEPPMIRESQEAHTNFVPPPQEVPSSLLPLLGHRSQLRMDITSLEDRRDDVQRIANQTTGREHAAAVSRLAELESQLDAARLALSVVDRELAGHTGAPVVYTEAPSPPPFVSISSPAFPDEVLYAAGGAGAILMLGMLAMMVYMRSVARTTRNALSVIESQVSSQHATLASGIEAIAVEVERLGEGQRFMSKLIANESQGVPAPRPNH